MTEAPPHTMIATPGRVTAGWESVRYARWAAAAPRFIAMTVIFLFFGFGVRAVFFPPPASVSPAPEGVGVDAPAEDFALQFARAYLTYDARWPERRERALAPFVPQGLDFDGGFVPASGAQYVLWAEVASNQRALAGGRVITVAAQVSTQSQPLYLAVTVRHPRRHPLFLVGYPSFVGAPAVDTAGATAERDPVDDPAVVQVAERVVRNYLAGQAPNLEADLTADAVVTLPTIRLRVESVDDIVWTAGRASGAVLVTVTAVDSRGGAYTLTYELGIAYLERPYVDFIQVIPTDT